MSPALLAVDPILEPRLNSQCLMKYLKPSQPLMGEETVRGEPLDEMLTAITEYHDNDSKSRDFEVQVVFGFGNVDSVSWVVNEQSSLQNSRSQLLFESETDVSSSRRLLDSKFKSSRYLATKFTSQFNRH